MTALALPTSSEPDDGQPPERELTDLSWFMDKQKKIERADILARKNLEVAVLARWEFGMQLLDERRGRKLLPRGRLAEVCQATGISASEARHRMRLALRYPTLPEVSTAVESCGSWTALRATLYAVPDLGWLDAMDTRAEDQAATNDYDAAYPDGQPYVARPKSRQSEALENALLRMFSGAQEVERLMQLEPMVPFAVMVAELPPTKVEKWLASIVATHNAVKLITVMQQKPRT